MALNLRVLRGATLPQIREALHPTNLLKTDEEIEGIRGVEPYEPIILHSEFKPLEEPVQEGVPIEGLKNLVIQ